MSFYKFQPGDIFHNRVKTHPKSNFYIYNGSIYYNSKSPDSGSHADNSGHVPVGHISLHELNIDRQTPDLAAGVFTDTTQTKNKVFPFITKEGSLTTFSTVTTTSFNNDFSYGDHVSGSYPLSSSIHREYYAASSTRTEKHIEALKNTLNYYIYMSPHYEYTNDSKWDKGVDELGLISIPSIFYGSSIKKGSVDLRYFITGSLVGRLQDINRNGELIQVSPTGSTGSGSVAGTVLYNEGFIVLTGSWQLGTNHATTYDVLNNASDKQVPKWIYFGVGANDKYTSTDASFNDLSFYLSFKGTNIVPTVTMLAHAQRGELNHSNNPTFLSREYNQMTGSWAPSTSSYHWSEHSRKTIKNIVRSKYTNHTASFQKTTYLSQIAIYDENKNIIAIAKMATPVRKTEDRDYTFKLKLDI